jgi:hypothetical protein
MFAMPFVASAKPSTYILGNRFRIDYVHGTVGEEAEGPCDCVRQRQDSPGH